jgi:carboxyl-terminal processing protease
VVNLISPHIQFEIAPLLLLTINMSRIIRVLTSLALGLALLSSVVATPPQQKSRKRVGAQRRAQVRKDPARERRLKTFQLVWQTVKDEHFDPTLGGVNWDAVRARYAPRVQRVRSDQELHSLLQEMLGELPQSHFTIVPPERIPRIKAGRKRSDKGEMKEDEVLDLLEDQEENESDNDVAMQMMNGIGVDVRVLEGRVVITRIAADSPAARAGLRPGFIIKSIDDMSFDGLLRYAVEETALQPLIHMRLREEILVDYLGGQPGTDVRLLYLDEQGREREVSIKRERLSGSLSSAVGNLPPLYTEFEAKRVAGEIGYLRFSTFTPQVADKICAALKTMRDAPGLIVDLRGNPGGVMAMASGVIGLLVNKAGLIGVIRTRKGSLPLAAYPQRSTYQGPVVVILDRLSASTSEVLAAALQETGRAKVVGERSAGMVLGADIIKLPTGALFEYARTGFITFAGATLEGAGVIPDAEKKLDRAALLKGEDSQLQEAIRQIGISLETARRNAPSKLPQPAPLVIITPNVVIPKTTPDNPTSPPAPVKTAESPPPGKQTFVSTPEAEQIIERHLQAVGGREAVERLKSRLSVGVSRLPLQGITGKVTIYEEAPDKRSMEVNIPNMGVMKFVYDGKRGWMQHPLMGFAEIEEPMLSVLRREYNFYRMTRYRELFARMDYKGMRETEQGRVNVIELTSPGGYREELHFDVASGLLVYGSGTQLGDYRQVGEVKVPFLQKVSIAGLDVVMQFEQITHNVPISAEAFAESQSCFGTK